MKLHIENFAKISSADILFDGLTVIAGDNNTGKSTVGKVLYSIFRGTSNVDRRIQDERVRAVKESVSSVARAKISDDEANQLIEGECSVHDFLAQKFKTEFGGEKSRVSVGHIDQVADDFARTFEKRVREQIDKTLAMPPDRVEWVILRRVFECVFHGQYHPLKQNSPDAVLKIEVENELNSIVFHHDFAEFKSSAKLFAYAILLSDSDVMSYVNIKDIGSDPFASRILDKNVYELVMRLARDAVSSPGILEEGRRESLSAALVQLDRMIQGRLGLDDQGDLALYEEGNAQPTKVQNLSMGMKSLLLLRTLLVKGVLNERDVLILDEPENHLHPEWQVFYAKALVLIQKAYNLTMLVTTHSQFFVNALQRFSISEGIADKTNFYLSGKDESRPGYCTFEHKGRFAGRIMRSFGQAYDLIGDLSGETADEAAEDPADMRRD